MSLLISTMNDVPGWRVDRVLGEVTGLTKQLQQTRDEAVQRMIDAAQARGANAVLAMRFDSNEVGNGYQEIVAYGTAVVVVAPAPQA
jgi:uncharacterized protein YbjQ (UPF0145 family)